MKAARMPSERVPPCNDRGRRLTTSALDTMCAYARMPNCTFTKTMQVLPILDYGKLLSWPLNCHQRS